MLSNRIQQQLDGLLKHTIIPALGEDIIFTSKEQFEFAITYLQDELDDLNPEHFVQNDEEE